MAPLAAGLKPISRAAYVAPSGVGTCFLPQLQCTPLPVHNGLCGRTNAKAQINIVFLTLHCCTGLQELEWLYPCIYLVNSYPLFHIPLKSNSISGTFSDLAGRMCSNNTLSFRGNEIELEGHTCNLASRLLFAVLPPPKAGGRGGVWLSWVNPWSSSIAPGIPGSATVI